MENCFLHRSHSPVHLNAAVHHVLPRSWGGPDTPANRVVLCPTGHENVHTTLNWFVKYGGPDKVPATLRVHAGTATWRLALVAWDSRPSKPLYTLHIPTNSST